MDQRFLPAFRTQARQLLGNNLFKEIRNVISSVESEVLSPPYHLRTDGLLFLLINIGYMIVLPWEYTEVNDFLTRNREMLREDLTMVMTEAKNRVGAPAGAPAGAIEISASTLLDAVATRKSQMRIF